MADFEKRMNINWILANDYVPDPTIDLGQLKTCGAFWGGWQTWRACGTDTVICHDMGKASDLIKRAFHAVCNFYIPNSIYTSLDRPAGVRLYEGNFVHDLDNHEEIVAMHLVASASDIVLMLGYNFIEPAKKTTLPAEVLPISLSNGTILPEIIRRDSEASKSALKLIISIWA